MGRVKKSDAREMQSFYQHYYKKYIQALQSAADKADRYVFLSACGVLVNYCIFTHLDYRLHDLQAVFGISYNLVPSRVKLLLLVLLFLMFWFRDFWIAFIILFSLAFFLCFGVLCVLQILSILVTSLRISILLLDIRQFLQMHLLVIDLFDLLASVLVGHPFQFSMSQRRYCGCKQSAFYCLWFLWGGSNKWISRDIFFTFDSLNLIPFHALFLCQCKHTFIDYSLSSLISNCRTFMKLNPLIGVWGFYLYISFTNEICFSS